MISFVFPRRVIQTGTPPPPTIIKELKEATFLTTRTSRLNNLAVNSNYGVSSTCLKSRTADKAAERIRGAWGKSSRFAREISLWQCPVAVTTLAVPLWKHKSGKYQYNHYSCATVHVKITQEIFYNLSISRQENRRPEIGPYKFCITRAV